VATIKIEKVIAHHMNLDFENPTCLNRLIDISKPELALVVNFFAKHIKNAITASQLKTCLFKSATGNVYSHCNTIAQFLQDDQKFIDSSIDMTKKLHGYMRTTSSRSSGALIFIIYKNNDTNQHYLGILKMDPNEGIEIDPQNVTFIVRQNMLPNTKENLHKSAFIKLKSNLIVDTSHLFVLDKQQKADGVSKFFLNSFLDAKEVVEDKKMTSLLSETLMEVAKEESLNIFSFKNKLDQHLTDGSRINVDNVLEDLFREHKAGEEDRKELIENVKEKMKKKTEDAYFEFTVEKNDKSFYYLTNSDSSLRIRFPESMFENIVFYEEDYEDGEKVSIIKIKGEHLNIKNMPK
jgi:hypothetical protein